MGLGLVQILLYRSAESSILAEWRPVCYLGHTLGRVKGEVIPQRCTTGGLTYSDGIDILCPVAYRLICVYVMLLSEIGGGSSSLAQL